METESRSRGRNTSISNSMIIWAIALFVLSMVLVALAPVFAQKLDMTTQFGTLFMMVLSQTSSYFLLPLSAALIAGSVVVRRL